MPGETTPDQSACFHYYDVSASESRIESVTLEQLAVRVEADWRPGLPTTFSSGLANVLSGILSREQPGGDARFWTVDGSVAGYERQWKGVASWLVGVAFCRLVVDSHLPYPYPWCAHVSAFPERSDRASNPLRQLTLLPQGWPSDFSPNPDDCGIKRRVAGVLMPDYVLLRPGTDRPGYELSFAESKGTAQGEQGTLRLPSDHQWHNQRTNAEFWLGQQVETATQELLVVTRVSPADGAPYSRQVIVRAWNRHHPGSTVGFEVAQRVLFAHYYGVCRRIGFQHNAKLLAMAAPFLSSEARPDSAVHERAWQDLATGILRDGPPTALARGRGFELGKGRMRLALAEPAVTMVRWLQDGGGQAGERLVGSFADQTEPVRRAAKGMPGVVVREDGVVAFPEGPVS